MNCTYQIEYISNNEHVVTWPDSVSVTVHASRRVAMEIAAGRANLVRIERNLTSIAAHADELSQIADSAKRVKLQAIEACRAMKKLVERECE